MSTTVEITLDDSGALTVGIVDQPSADVDSQTQAKDVAQALTIAKHLLENPPADTDDTASGDDQQPDASGDGSTAASAGADSAQGAPDASGAGGAGQPSAADMWNELSSDQPAH